MGASITLAGESLIAQKLGSQQRLDVVRFIFANVPGLDPNAPVNRAAAKPPASQIVHSYTIPQQNVGYVNPNQVVYSSMLGSDIGDFDWNWIGLETAENVLLAVAYMPLQQKRKNIPPLQLGNNVTRNILVVFDGAQALTGVTIDAKTWQHDFTIRLKGIDERERRSNRDIFGRACFFSDGFQVEKVGNGYQIKPGLAYVDGIRIELANTLPITLPAMPTPVYLDVSLRRERNDTMAVWTVAYGGVDYTDSADVRHYLIALAYVKTSEITDFRTVEPITGPLIQHLAARVGDYPQLRARATTKDDVELGNLPNAISDDAGTDSSSILATTKAVSGARKVLQQAIDKLIDGTTPAGKAKQLETARKVSISGVGTGSATFDGTADVNINVTMPDIVASWKYTKVTVNSKGLVTFGEYLQPADIPVLDWSKITSGKPTTVEGYGITNALITGRTTQQRPSFASPSTGGFATGGGAIEIREAKENGSASSDYAYAPRILFHWGGVQAHELGMDSTGGLRWSDRKVWTEHNFNPDSKANNATTAEGYGITNVLLVGKVSQQRPSLAAPTPGGVNGQGGALEIREVQQVGDGQTDFAYAPAITFHWGGRYGRQLAMDRNGDLCWHGQTLFHTGNLNPSSIVPAGAIMAFAMSAIPAGYLKANGAAVSRTTYAALFAQINTYYGAGDGVNTFNLPDLRGLFVRGLDEGRGLDPGRGFGTFQWSQNLWHDHAASSDVQGQHTHGLLKAASGNNSSGPYVSPANAGNTLSTTEPAGAHSHNITVGASGGNESRPVNIAVIYCIKY
ncbi:phage tail protein [Pseudomonas fluorescens]|uniref:phage tail-collar fiber domain-containing protein n=1 Tax=Pseudomonas fluorescens TaxID=294 RepID=UPI001BDA2BFB|nr:phage tail protein [Pseudomonas fluorescens]MBT0624368.1 phage tail protein [Pseudomonas fluorescens]